MYQLTTKKDFFSLFNLIMWCIFAILSTYETFLSETIFSGITKYFLIVWCIGLFIFYLFKVKKNLSFIQISMIFMLLYYILSLIWTDNLDQASFYIFTVSLSIILLVLTSSFGYSSSYVNIILSLFKYVSISFAIISFFAFETIANGTRYVVSLLGVELDPNNQVALIGIGSGLCLLAVFSNVGFSKIINIIYFSLCAISIFRCGSRSGIVLLLIQFLVIAFFWKPNNKSMMKVIFKYFFVTLILFIVFFLLTNFIPSNTLERLFGLGDLKFTDGTEREFRWLTGIDIFMKNPLFGNGWGTFECHNTFLTLLVDIGLIGNLFFYFVLILIFLTSIKRKDCAALMIFLSGMIPSFFIGAQNKRFFWISLILPIIILFCKEKHNVLEKNIK